MKNHPRVMKMFAVVLLYSIFFSNTMFAGEWVSRANFESQTSSKMKEDFASGRCLFENGSGQSVVVIPGMDFALVNGNRVELKDQARWERGELMVPKELLAKISTMVIVSQPQPTIKIPVVDKPVIDRPVIDRPVKFDEPKKPLKSDGIEPYVPIRKIMIDAGHGGKDPGAMGFGLSEKEITLDVAKQVEKILKAKGIEVVMARSTDVFVSLDERSAMANKEQPDLFLSIHVNAAAAASAAGYEIYVDQRKYTSEAKADKAAKNSDLNPEKYGTGQAPSEEYEEQIYRLLIGQNWVQAKKVADSIHSQFKANIKDKDRGVKTANFHVLRESFVPAILVELGFLSNAGTAKNLKTAEYRQKLSQSIADGVLKYNQKQSE